MEPLERGGRGGERVNLISSIGELSKRSFEVIVIGSGPAGVAVTEQLYRSEVLNKARIAVLEQGPVLALTHINNVLGNKHRRAFIERFKTAPWDGTFADGGMLLPALGGRGIAAGAHLRRFDTVDFHLWDNGRWPDEVVTDLNATYYALAERRRKVSVGSLRGPAQVWAIDKLRRFNPAAPTIGVDLSPSGGFEINQGVDSSVARLWSLLLEDALVGSGRRLDVATETHVTRLRYSGNRIVGVECRSSREGVPREAVWLSADIIVLAASTIESTRLVLNSGIARDMCAVGCFLAEHIERRAKIKMDDPHPEEHSDGVSLVLHTRSDASEDRFQVHLRGQIEEGGKLVIDIGGFAAMDPSEDNRVTLSSRTDEFGLPRAHVELVPSALDRLRADRMCERIREVAGSLGGEFITEEFPLEGKNPVFTDASREIQLMSAGRSYHEAGGLRMGSDGRVSVTDVTGRIRGVDNLYVADASVFPSVGVANPMLTITALGYRVADRVVSSIAGQPA